MRFLNTSGKNWLKQGNVHTFFAAMCLGLLAMTLVPIPATADPQAYNRSLQWVTIDKPGLIGNVVVHPSDVTDIAVGSSLFYANDSVHSKLYRSMTSGVRWEDITPFVKRKGAVLPITEIAIAPDQPAIIAAADSASELFVSVDGGVTWADIDFNGVGNIQSLAISKSYGDSNEQRDILVGTAGTFGLGATVGGIWLYHMGSSVPRWLNLNLTVDPAVKRGEVTAVAFSPNYTSDQAVVAIASTSGDADIASGYRNRTYLCLGLVDISTASSTLWNAATGYPNCSSYPVEIFDSAYYSTYSQSSGDNGVTLIDSGLEVSGSFSATSTSLGARKVYCFYRVDPATVLNDTSNVYRIDDSVSPTVKAFTCTGVSRYSSVALSGNTLVAGVTAPRDSLTSIVRISTDAGASSPYFIYQGFPYGPGNVKLAWCSGTLYCGTGGRVSGTNPDESGFSTSTDSGLHWVQVSLIDTTVKLEDVALAAKPQSIFMTSTSTSNIESVWRSAGEPEGKYWGRVLAENVLSDNIAVRLSQHYRDDYTVYACELGHQKTLATDNSSLWMSNDRGNSWTKYVAPVEIIDMAVVDKNVSYLALPGGYIAKTENGGRYWKTAISSELTNIAMLSMSDNNTILVGGKFGDVSYSLDGGKSFTRIARTMPESGIVQVVADTGFNQNKIIYAGCGNSIYRWTIGQSSNWENIRTIDTQKQISGMSCVDGILYGLWYSAAYQRSGAERSLVPTLPLGSIEWSTLQARENGVNNNIFNCSPSALRYQVTSNSVILWAIDTSSDTSTVIATDNTSLMMYIDCLAFSGPKLTMSDKKAIDCDTTTGRGEEVNFTWGAVCEDTAYQLQIFKDSNLQWRFFDCEDAWPFLVPADVLSPGIAYMGGQSRKLPIMTDNVTMPLLECGRTYYWRIRTRAGASGENITSPWSETRSFTVKPGYKVATPYYGPQLLEPKGGCGYPCGGPASFSWTPFKGTTSYKYELSTNADMSSPLVSASTGTSGYEYQGQLECGKSYFWRVRAEQPVLSDWSAVFSFTVLPEAETMAADTQQSVQVPRWVWLVCGLGCVLILAIAAMVMILK
ncbi:MAG: hypothetical protein EHM12_03535 [Dehalococcoidia bacterium]|nr:MAG: hypothetical protein EHM12_03535 [Dehalococcoidia bacterium]